VGVIVELYDFCGVSQRSIASMASPTSSAKRSMA